MDVKSQTVKFGYLFFEPPDDLDPGLCGSVLKVPTVPTCVTTVPSPSTAPWDPLPFPLAVSARNARSPWRRSIASHPPCRRGPGKSCSCWFEAGEVNNSYCNDGVNDG